MTRFLILIFTILFSITNCSQESPDNSKLFEKSNITIINTLTHQVDKFEPKSSSKKIRLTKEYNLNIYHTYEIGALDSIRCYFNIFFDMREINGTNYLIPFTLTDGIFKHEVVNVENRNISYHNLSTFKITKQKSGEFEYEITFCVLNGLSFDKENRKYPDFQEEVIAAIKDLNSKPPGNSYSKLIPFDDYYISNEVREKKYCKTFIMKNTGEYYFFQENKINLPKVKMNENLKIIEKGNFADTFFVDQKWLEKGVSRYRSKPEKQTN